MSIKFDLLFRHLNKFPEKYGNMSEEQGQKF